MNRSSSSEKIYEVSPGFRAFSSRGHRARCVKGSREKMHRQMHHNSLSPVVKIYKNGLVLVANVGKFFFKQTRSNKDNRNKKCLWMIEKDNSSHQVVMDVV